MNNLRPWLFFILLCATSLFASLWLRGGTDATPFALVHSLAADINNWYGRLKSSNFARHKATDSPALTGHSSSTSHSQSASNQNSGFARSDHTAQDRHACTRPPFKSRTDTDAKLIYKWIDEDGQTHMSDEHPAGVIASVMDLGMKKRDFTYQIRSEGIPLPIDFSGQLSAGSKRIYDTWHYFLGDSKLRQSNIQVLVIGGPDRFDAYHANASPGSKPVNGFYSMSKNLAVVKYDPENQAQTVRTTFHEVSHLITASHLGPTPPWLTEGLAEYFETMQVTGQAGVIYPNQAHIKRLRKTPLPRLHDYLAIDRPEWHGAQRDRNYAIAWSLVHFLLEGSPGIYALREVIQQAETNFCKPFSAVAALNTAYPGGIQRLEQDWRRWLASGQHQIQQT